MIATLAQNLTSPAITSLVCVASLVFAFLFICCVAHALAAMIEAAKEN